MSQKKMTPQSPVPTHPQHANPPGDSGTGGIDIGSKTGKNLDVPTPRLPRPDLVQEKRFNQGFALIVGVSTIKRHPEATLPPVLFDAVEMRWTLENPQTCGYPKDQVKLLLDSEATAEGIRDGLQWLAQTATPDSTAIFYFSGHGLNRINDRQSDSCLVAHDADLERGTGILRGDELTELLQAIGTSRLAVFLDCCYAGGTGELKSSPNRTQLQLEIAAGLPASFYEGLMDDGRGRVIMASSGPDQISIARPGMKHSLFTHYLIKALRGEAASKDDLIRVFETYKYIEGNISRERGPTPVLKTKLEQNFALALAQYSQQTHQGGNRRSRSERRGYDERRESSPLDRLRDGFWKKFHDSTCLGFDEPFRPHLSMPSTFMRHLEKEAVLYEFTQDGIAKDPQIVLSEAIDNVFEQLSREREIGCRKATDRVAWHIGSRYDVHWGERRSGTDRRRK